METRIIDGVEYVPVVHARWIRASNKPYVNVGIKCSHCKARISYSEEMSGNHLYCYKCGARMDEQEAKKNDH